MDALRLKIMLKPVHNRPTSYSKQKIPSTKKQQTKILDPLYSSTFALLQAVQYTVYSQSGRMNNFHPYCR